MPDHAASESLAACGSVTNRDLCLDPSVHYVCQRCTACCRWPGDVRLEPDEITTIAMFMGMNEDLWIATFTRLRHDRQGLSLLEAADGACIMLDPNGACQIHPVKPAQCRGFPNQWRFPGWRNLCKAREEIWQGRPPGHC